MSGALRAGLIALALPASSAVAIETLGWGAVGEPRRPWREVRYAGRTRYSVVERDGERLLRAESRAQNSSLLQTLDLDPRGVTLAWRWRVLTHPRGADPEVRARDDRAAAVVVVVRRSLLPWRTRALLYQWAPARPLGEWSRSPRSSEVCTLVLRNAEADSTWREERRDLGGDLAQAFGETPARIAAVGVICDADDTRADALAEFGPLRIEIARDRSPR